MSELTELSQRISELFEMMNLEVPSEETDLFETALLDSLKFVELLAHLEEQLGVSVSLDQLEPDNFRSIQRIASFTIANRRLPESAAGIDLTMSSPSFTESASEADFISRTAFRPGIRPLSENDLE